MAAAAQPEPDLHALVAGFADAAAVYERGRPGYPPAVVERVVAELGVRSGARVLDLGAGTGKMTRPLLAAGLDVVAVEPLAGMRAALAAGVGAERVLDGRAEAIPLADASLDGAVSTDAFHWFDGERAAAELHRVLRPGAGLVVTWLIGGGERSPIEHESDLDRELIALLEPLWERGRHPSIKLGRRAEAIAAHDGFAPIRRAEVPFEDAVDREGFVAWLASFSVVGALGDREREAFLARVAGLFDRHAGSTLTRRWRADLWVTHRRR
jgi:SAM-dependent methyltransferase